jgi:G3E family GTPase
VKIIIFGGFVGSGKTSLILSLARYIVGDTPPVKPKLVIIENEIGDVSIDDKVLKAGGYNVTELFGGCVCCQLTSDMTNSVNNIFEKYNPEWIIIEATGLAYPGNILGTLLKYGKGLEEIKTITVVDSERWTDLRDITPVLLEKQVGECGLALINKIDLVGEEVLELVVNDVKKINPKAEIIKLSAAKEIDTGLWEKVLRLNERK